ncbi:MAG: OsmC family peroxiredoxin [Crocinitomicaceae bacterium TMED114]|nr:MAG: OsmC family peroxiredoxin [Crocinitomicaceae bacterium TMED114]
MKYALTYPEPLRTQAVHQGNRQTLLTDAPTDNGGLGEAFSPTDLVAVGLASCIMTILGLRAASRNLTIQSMEASTEKKMSPNPRRIARVEVELTVSLEGGTDADRDWLREEALSCPVALSLHPDLRQEIRIGFV